MLRFVKKLHVTAAAAGLCGAALLAACNSGAGGANNGGTPGAGGETAVAAVVNGKNIMLSEVDRILSQQSGGQQAQFSPLELAAARLQVLEGLIQQEVLFQRAEKDKLIPTDDEVNQEIAARKQQSRLTDEEYARALRESNQTEQSQREAMRKEIATRRLQERVVGKISIIDKEVEDYYNNNKATFVNARGVGLSDIVADPRDNQLTDDAKSPAEAKSKIDLIYQRLRSGADFAAVAREKSEDPSNVRGGDIGFATEEQLKQTGFPAELVSRLFTTMQVGDVTAPLQFPNGNFYIFKLTGRQLQNENLTLESPGVRDRIKELLLNQRRQLLNATLLSVALNETKVQNNLALNMLNSPSNLSGLRPAAPPPNTNANSSATPAAGGGAAAAANANAATTNGNVAAPAR